MQTTWPLIQAIMQSGFVGLFISIILAFFLLSKRGISSNAWISAMSAIIAFILSGFTIGNMLSLANVVGPIAGYFLVVLAIARYLKDRKMKQNSESINTHDFD
jgi:hypothetical protein